MKNQEILIDEIWNNDKQDELNSSFARLNNRQWIWSTITLLVAFFAATGSWLQYKETKEDSTPKILDSINRTQIRQAQSLDTLLHRIENFEKISILKNGDTLKVVQVK